MSSDDRPGVLTGHGDGLTYVTCPVCGVTHDIDLPVLVVRPDHPFQLLFGFPDSYRDRGAWAGYEELLTEAAEARGSRLSGWHLEIPRVLLRVALVRDLVADIQNVDAACSDLAELGEPLVARYRIFLTRAAEGTLERAVAEALMQLWGVLPDQLAPFLAAHPELGSSTAVEAVRRQLDAGPPPGESDKPLRDRLALVESLHRGDPVDEVARQYLQDVGAFGTELQRRTQQTLEALDMITPDDVSPAALQQFRDAHDLAQGVGDEHLEAALAADLSARLLNTNDPQVVEEVIELCTRALTLLDDDDARVAILVNLSNAYASRLVGDRTENWDRAHALLTEADRLVDRAIDPQRWAVIQTNLAYLLEQRPGRKPDDLRTALRLVREGLEERSPSRNVVDWAFSQLHLGLINSRLHEAETEQDRRTSDPDLTRRAYEEALQHLRPQHHRSLWLTISNNLADTLLLATPPDTGRARGVVETASAEINDEEATTVPARLEWLLARIADIEHGSDSEVALSHRRRTLDLLDRTPDREMFLRVAGELTDSYGQLGRWAEAADIYERAIAAHRWIYAGQLYTDSRRHALGSASRLARWAAYCLTRAGRPHRAVELLEEGCARQLSESVTRSTIELDALAAVDAALHRQWIEATERLRELLDAADSGLIGTERASAVRAEATVRDVLIEIRAIPGFEQFLQPLTSANIAAAGDGLPIVYIVNAPAGSVVFGVGTAATEPIVHAVEVPDITSLDVLRVVAADDNNRPTLLRAQAGNATQRRDQLPAALARLGELRPLAEGLEAVLSRFRVNGVRADAAVVVPTGLLGMVPLHALPATAYPCLDDALEIRLAPSAAIYAASTRRVRQEHPLALVAIADTLATAPLRGARYETSHLQSIFSGAATILTGREATRQLVIASARQCTHLHFACHGQSRIDDPLGGELLLADAALTIDDLLDGRLNYCRLVVASACQSGHYAITQPSDDFTGLAAGFLRAGAAAAVVTLWQVSDLATALLISYFYEQLDLGNHTSAQETPAALRAARRWLRQLTRAAARDFVRAREALAPLDTSFPNDGDDDQPFATPLHWAPFYCYGR